MGKCNKPGLRCAMRPLLLVAVSSAVYWDEKKDLITSMIDSLYDVSDEELGGAKVRHKEDKEELTGDSKADEPKAVTDQELGRAKGRHEEDVVDLTCDSPMSDQEEIDTSRLFEYGLTEDTLNPDKDGKIDNIERDTKENLNFNEEDTHAKYNLH